MKSYFSTNRVLAWTIASVAVAALFFACKKEVTADTAATNENDNNAIMVAGHEAQANAIYGDLFETMTVIALDQNVVKPDVRKADFADYANTASCPSILISSANPAEWPKQIIVDYGDACRDNFGITRSGKMYINITGLLFAQGTKIGIHLEDYKRNGIPVAGADSVYNITYNTTTGVQYTTEVTGGKVRFSDTLVLAYTSKKTVKQTAGAGTPQLDDNVYTVEGNAAITYEKGGPAGSATIATQSPLVKASNCAHVSQGQLQVAFSNITALIDYGNGICDDKATITVNGDKMKEISLGK